MNIIELIKEAEGLRLESYLCPAGIPTIGYGHTGPDIKLGMTCTLQQAEEWLHDDYCEAVVLVRRSVGVPLSDNQLDALASFVFNLGIGRLKTSTLLKKLNSWDYKGAAAEFDKWVYGSGKKLPGLVKRRAAERKLFES